MSQSNRYYEAMEKITTPPPLKEKVAKKIRKQIIRRRMIRTGVGVSVLAASLLVVIGLGFWQNGPKGLIHTDLTEGQHEQQVILEDGELNFVFREVDESQLGIRLAPMYPVQQTLALEKVIGVLPENPPTGLSVGEVEITGYMSQLGGEPEMILGEVVYWGEKGGTLTISFTDNPTFLPLPVPMEGSYIEGIELGVGFDESVNIYYGVFERNGYLLALTGEGLSQEEFIHFLHYFVKYETQ